MRKLPRKRHPPDSQVVAEVFWSCRLIIGSLTLADMLLQVERPEPLRGPQTTPAMITQTSRILSRRPVVFADFLPLPKKILLFTRLN